MSRFLALISIIGLVGSPVSAADIVLDNGRVRLTIGQDALWRSLVDKATDKNYCAAGKKIPLAAVRIGTGTHAANRLALNNGRLILQFANCDTQCTYQVTANPSWIAFRLEKISGTRPSALTLLSVGVTITERVGPVLCAAWNDQYAVCLRGINLQTHTQPIRLGDHIKLEASSQDGPGPRLEGSGAALLTAPPVELPRLLGILARTYDLPRNEVDGIASRDLPTARQSYWFLSFGEKEVDKVIAYCRRTGFRQVMMGSGSWCSLVGHYTFNTRSYPKGLESLRRTVGQLHQAGILVGMHTFASKISKLDAYVTPVPDRRFCVDRTATLAEDIGLTAATIRTHTDLSQWPGSPVCRQKMWEGGVAKHQEVIIDDEIVAYNRIGPQGKWDSFEGCRRGAWKTHPAEHRAQTECRHYAVDGCINGYIVDLDSTLFEETSSRLAAIFNTCQFDMVYFDGSEDVDPRRFNYYAAKAHAVPMRKFDRRPLIHQGGGFGNEIWHSFTRNATADTYFNTLYGYILAGGKIDRWPTVKDHIDRSVQAARRCADDMTPGELGWFGIWPKGQNTDGLQYDEIEYLMCKSLALDAPISLQTSFSQMESHPLLSDILEIVRVYEDLRSRRKVPEKSRKQVGEPGRDYVLLPPCLCANPTRPEFLAVQAVPAVAGTHDLRAFLGSQGLDAIATLWHYLGQEGKLVLDTTALFVYDVKGEPMMVKKQDGKASVPLDNRRLTLRFAGLGKDAAKDLLARAHFEPRKPTDTSSGGPK